MSAATTLEVSVSAARDIPSRDVDEARRRMAALAKYASRQLSDARIVLRRGGPHATQPFIADASVRFDGRLLAAHAAGATASEAAGHAADRLRRQLLRVAEASKEHRSERSAVEQAIAALELDARDRPHRALKPAEQRQIVHRRTYADQPVATLTAIADMIDLDEEFHLFRHVRTGEDVVVHRRDDGRIGLLFPAGSALAEEADLVVTEPSRYAQPLTLEAVRAEMDLLDHRFVYFIDAADDRGKILYLRHDGDYGLVEPE